MKSSCALPLRSLLLLVSITSILAIVSSVGFAAEGSRLVVYVTSWCPYCKALEAELKAHNIPYIRHDIEADSVAAEEYSRLGGGGVPLVTVDGRLVDGSVPEIQRELGSGKTKPPLI